MTEKSNHPESRNLESRNLESRNLESNSLESSPTLDSAPEEIKLAVDLIYLLESNEIDPKVALDAIEIVKQDLESKIEPAH